ncbi:MAG TPA: ankyrin repeat domain-containing protein, partial [Vicinamibacterales bacterium]|nr:ankyrin repeat domain-containing protein [Vicinamibacterales bacterium]
MVRRLMSARGLIAIVAVLAVSATVLRAAAADDTPVADAAMRGDRAAVKSLLEQGADVNAAQNDGMTALHWAAVEGDLPLAQMLIYAGADTHATTRLGGYTPLDIAAKDGHADIVQALLKGGADPRSVNAYGTTSLMLAAASGSVPAVTALVEAGADVNAREHVHGETALMLAAAYDRPDAMQVLLAHGADWRPTSTVLDWDKLPKNDPRLPHFHFPGANAAKAKAKGGGAPGAAAHEKGQAATAGVGQKKQTNPFLHRTPYWKLVGTQGGLSALLFAARQGYTDAAMILLDHGADVNEVDPGDHTSPLLIAIINGHYDLAEQLLAHGADPNLAELNNGVTPLYAVINCQWSAKVDYPQPTAYKQQKTSYLTLMKDLLAHGANSNARLKEKVWYSGYNFDLSGLDETGATPFWRAAYAADVDAMKILVAHGADPAVWTRKPNESSGFYRTFSKVDHSGLKPVPVGGPDIPPLLAAAGEGYGWSLTSNQHRFAPTGPLMAVKYLVNVLHVDVNARDADGNSALHDAAARGDNAMILFLVSKGADVTAVNRNGQSVADMANGPVQRVNPFPQTIALVQR